MSVVRRVSLPLFVLTVVLSAGLLTAFNVSILSVLSSTEKNHAVLSLAKVSAVGSLFLFFSTLLLFLLFQKEVISKEIRLLLLFGGDSFRILAPILREVVPLLGVSLILSFVGTFLLLGV